MAAKQPAIPEPQPDVDSLYHNARAVKEGMELLTGLKVANKLQAAVTWQDLVNLGLIVPSQVPVK